MIFFSFIISCFINIGLIFLLVLIGRQGEIIKVYKVYKINLVNLQEEKPKELKLNIPKPSIPKPKKKPEEIIQEELKLTLPIEEEPVKEEPIIPVKESSEEEANIILAVTSKEDKKQEIFEAKSLDSPINIIFYTLPKYPVRAKEMGIEGTVKIKLLINPSGGVEDVEIIEENPKGFGFKDEVLKVIKDYKFSQPMVLKKPVFVYCILPIRFCLEE